MRQLTQNKNANTAYVRHLITILWLTNYVKIEEVKRIRINTASVVLSGRTIYSPVAYILQWWGIVLLLQLQSRIRDPVQLPDGERGWQYRTVINSLDIIRHWINTRYLKYDIAVFYIKGPLGLTVYA